MAAKLEDAAREIFSEIDIEQGNIPIQSIGRLNTELMRMAKQCRNLDPNDSEVSASASRIRRSRPMACSSRNPAR